MRKASILTAFGVAALLSACRDEQPTSPRAVDAQADAGATLDPALVARGKWIFRFETFDDETFWTDTLKLHRVIRTLVSPTAALGLGLKVDVGGATAAGEGRAQG